MSEHIHKYRLQSFNNESGGVTIGVAGCSCGEVIGPTEIERRLNANEWLYRMSNEDIAAELSASWDLPLHITRGIAGWILTSAALEGEDGN